MSVTLLSTPEKTIDGLVSNVTAAISQAPFSFQAADFADKPNYKIEINILDENDVPFFPNITFRYSPNPDGFLFLDVGEIITQINKTRIALATRFKLQYAESWIDSPIPVFTTVGEYLGVYAEKQILSVGGANMFENVLNTVNLAQILTAFENPAYWEGFERTFSYLMDSNFQARTGLTEYQIENTEYDINKDLTGTILHIPETDLTPRLVIDTILNAGAYTGVRVVGLSEIVLYEKRQPCANPIMVDWINSLGGVDQWCFNIDQLFQRDAQEGLIYETAINKDIESVNRTKGRISPNWTQQIILRANNLKLDQLKALEEIKSSLSVRVWLNNTGEDWVGVIVSSQYNTVYNSGDAIHEFTLQLEMPDNFDVTEMIDYRPAFSTPLIDSDDEDLIDSDLEILTG